MLHTTSHGEYGYCTGEASLRRGRHAHIAYDAPIPMNTGSPDSGIPRIRRVYRPRRVALFISHLTFWISLRPRYPRGTRGSRDAGKNRTRECWLIITERADMYNTYRGGWRVPRGSRWELGSSMGSSCPRERASRSALPPYPVRRVALSCAKCRVCGVVARALGRAAQFLCASVPLSQHSGSLCVRLHMGPRWRGAIRVYVHVSLTRPTARTSSAFTSGGAQ